MLDAVSPTQQKTVCDCWRSHMYCSKTLRHSQSVSLVPDRLSLSGIDLTIATLFPCPKAAVPLLRLLQEAGSRSSDDSGSLDATPVYDLLNEALAPGASGGSSTDGGNASSDGSPSFTLHRPWPLLLSSLYLMLPSLRSVF